MQTMERSSSSSRTLSTKVGTATDEEVTIPNSVVLARANVQDVFNEYGVQIMSPHYLSDPAAPVVVPQV